MSAETEKVLREWSELWASKCPPDDWPEHGDMATAVLADTGRFILRVLDGEQGPPMHKPKRFDFDLDNDRCLTCRTYWPCDTAKKRAAK